MQVYIVTVEDYYANPALLAVFDSLEKAEKYGKSIINIYHRNFTIIEKFLPYSSKIYLVLTEECNGNPYLMDIFNFYRDAEIYNELLYESSKLDAITLERNIL